MSFVMNSFGRKLRCAKAMRGRRGVTSVLAMLYLILFGSLAIGFFAVTTTAVQVVKNEEHGSRALLNAESGLNFCRYYLMHRQVPRNTPKNEILDRLHEILSDEMDGMPVLNYGRVERIGDALLVQREGAEKPIRLDDKGNGFIIVIRQDDEDIVLTSIGFHVTAGGMTTRRGIEVRFNLDQNTPTLMDGFGIATRGRVLMDSNAQLRGLSAPSHANLLSTSTQAPQLTMLSNTKIEGNVSLTSPDGRVQKTSQTIGGGVEIGVVEPDFPEIVTAGLKDIVPLNIVNRNSDRNHRNIIIPPNSNPKLTGTIEGMIYIESPNTVTFDSNCVIRGIIVAPAGGSGTREIIFDSNTKLNGVDTLPETSDFPPALRALAGSLILAPEFKLTFNSNFGAAGGAIVGGEVYFDSNAAGSITGTILAMSEKPVVLKGNANIAIQRPPAGTMFPGVMFYGSFIPKRMSYAEGAPVLQSVSAWVK